MKKGFWVIACVAFALLVGCRGTEPTSTISLEHPSAIVPFYENRPMNINIVPKAAPARVGMLLPLSGKSAALADDLRNAGILAQFEVANENFTLSFYDTKGTADGARAAFEQAMNENMQIILGPLFAAEVDAIRSSAQKQNIPVFSFTSDADKLGNDVYSLALTIENQTQRIIRFACEKGAKRLAIMAPDNKAGDIAIDTAKRTANACGMEVEKLSVYNPTFINFEPYVLSVLPENFTEMRKEKIAQKKRARLGHSLPEETQEDTAAEKTIAEQLDFDALFIADDGNRLKSISSLFGLYDVTPDDVLFLGLSTWNEVSLSNEGSLKNAYYPLLPSEGYNAFAEKFKETYGKKPNRLASLAYDAVALSTALVNDGRVKQEVIHTPVGFLGTDGLFRFKKNGTAERLMGIYKIAGPKNFVRAQRPSPSFGMEDWKKEQLRDIKIINQYEEEDTSVEYVFEEEQPVNPTPATEATDLTSTTLP